MQTLIGSQLIEDLGINYFKEGSTFGALSENSIRYLLDQGEVLQLKKGEKLFECGDPGDFFYLILKGTIQLVNHREGEADYMRDFVFGEQLGFVAMIALHNRIGTALALKNSIVLKISNAVFYSLQETQPIDFGILLLNLSREMARQIGEYTISAHPRINGDLG